MEKARAPVTASWKAEVTTMTERVSSADRKEETRDDSLQRMLEAATGQVQPGQADIHQPSTAPARLYRLIDPSVDKSRALPRDALAGAIMTDAPSPFKSKSSQLTPSRPIAPDACGLIKHPFLVPEPAKRLYLQPVDAATLTPQTLAQEVLAEIERTPESRLDAYPFCAWVISRAPLPRIMAHLQGQRVIRRSGSPKPALLRYQDPRVFERLVEILSPEQLNHLLGPIEAWWYIDHRRQLRGIEMTPLPHPLPRTALGTHQWQALKRLGMVNRGMQRWRGLKRNDLWDVTPQEMDAALAEAERQGLTDEMDQLAFAQHALLVPGFYRHPAIQSALPGRQMPAGDDVSFCQAMKRLSAHDWYRIQHDREHRSS